MRAPSAKAGAPAGRVLEGSSAAVGFAVGRALRLARSERTSRSTAPARSLRDAVAQVRRDLQQLLAALPPDEAELFAPEAHILDEIEPGLFLREAAGASLEEAVFAETDCGCTDLIIDLRERLLGALEGASDTATRVPAAHRDRDVVLLADLVTPSMVVSLPRQVVAIVAASGTSEGERRDLGRASHAAILARGRGLPLAYVTPALLSSIAAAAWLVVDASERGARIWVDPADSAIAAARRRLAAEERERLPQAREPLDHLGIALRVNVASARDPIPPSADGVGLVRTEMMFLERSTMPGEDEQLAALLRVASKARGAPIVVRLFDAGGDKPVAWLGGETGSSRGIARLLSYPRALKTQLRALARARERAEIRVLLPFVRSPDDVNTVRRLAASTLSLGAMIESPDAVESIASIALAADFISIGTNDLTATSLGLERTRSLPLADPRVPALVRRTIAGAHAAGREVTICGEMAGDERGARIAVGLGADAISVAPASVAVLRAALARTTSAACVADAEAALGRPPSLVGDEQTR